jgi:Mce-associated membrane protein
MARPPTPASPAAEAPATEATEPEAQAAEGPDAAIPAPDADAQAAVVPAGEELVPDESVHEELVPNQPVHEELVPGQLVDGELADRELADGELVPEEIGTGEVVASDDSAETQDAKSPGADDSRTDSTGTDDSGAGDSSTATARPARGRSLVPVLLIAGACVLGGLAGVAAIQAHSLRSDQASRNTALTDAAATSQVRRQVTSAINTIFSYNYADTATTRAAAQRLLTGPAVREYDSLFRLVQQDAPAQHLVLTTKVTDAGVELLVGDRARVLIFADQRDTRKTTSQTSYAGAMFAVNAVMRDGRWKIENIDTFTGGS